MASSWPAPATPPRPVTTSNGDSKLGCCPKSELSSPRPNSENEVFGPSRSDCGPLAGTPGSDSGGRLNAAAFNSRAAGANSITANSDLWPPLLATVILASGAHVGLGQEALRSSLAGEEAVKMRRNALQNQPANLQWGIAKFVVGSALGLEWNDNVSYSDANQQPDLILRPAFSLGAVAPFTENNALYATFDISYAKYIKFPEYDRLVISPGTQVGFDIYVKDFHFDLHDAISVTDRPIAQGTISGAGDYGEFANVAGLGVDWDLSQVILSVNYDHENAIATTSSFSYLDRAVENFVGRATLQPSQSWSYGPEASGGIARYDEPVLADSENCSVGGFAAWQPTTLFHGNLRAGYTAFYFHSQPNQTSPPDTASYYLALKLALHLNEVVSLSVDAGRQARLGINSELLDLWYARPRADWRLFEKIGLDTRLTFERGSDKGSSVLSIDEDYTLLGGGLGAAYQILEKLLLRLDYDYIVKDSNLAERDYHQHRIYLQIQYTF